MGSQPPLQIFTLRFREGSFLRLNCNTVADFFYEREAIFDAQTIDSQILHADCHDLLVFRDTANER
jgi:hypothetical protein